MPQAPQKRPMTRALPWGLAATLFLISAWRWSTLLGPAESFVEPGQKLAAARPSVPAPALPAQAAFEDYRFALERPLLHPSRRPFPDRKALIALEAAAKAKQVVQAPAPAAPPPPSVVQPPQGFLLRGTVIAGPLQSAVFERSGSQSYIRIRAGEQLDGWTLIKIARAEVQLRFGDQTVTWPLAKDTESRQRRP